MHQVWFYITKCHSFITKCGTYYQMCPLLQNASAQLDLCLFSSRDANFSFEKLDTKIGPFRSPPSPSPRFIGPSKSSPEHR